MAGTLHLVGTPIGNLGDVTARAVEVLRTVAFVVCEDTRHSGPWLRSLGVTATLVSLPAFAEKARARSILDRMEAGEDAALITDAGSPGISDPGEFLVAEALVRGVAVVPVPGPSALVAALSASGLPSGRFHFAGFLPRGQSDRAAVLEELAGLRATLVFYDAARRLGETLADLHRLLGDRRAVVARELTKVHEEFVRGTLGELATRYARRSTAGRGGADGGGAERGTAMVGARGAGSAGGGARPRGAAQGSLHRGRSPGGMDRRRGVPARSARSAMRAHRPGETPQRAGGRRGRVQPAFQACSV